MTADDKRFQYVRTATSGLSIARNIALERARGPIIAFTDDDCTVAPTWLERLVDHFQADPRIGLVCGAVLAGSHDQQRGFIPIYQVPHTRMVTTPWMKWREGGIGANMALRSEVLKTVGPFDEVLGAGGMLYSCEDGDMTYRVLKAGYAVLSASDACVTHHGFRTWEQGKVLMRQTAVGVAAAYMKHLRLGDISIVPTLIREWLRCISWRRLLLLQRRAGVARFLAYGQGFLRSFDHDIDRRRRMYIRRERLTTEECNNRCA